MLLTGTIIKIHAKPTATGCARKDAKFIYSSTMTGKCKRILKEAILSVWKCSPTIYLETEENHRNFPSGWMEPSYDSNLVHPEQNYCIITTEA